MTITELGEHLYLIDLETAGMQKFIASYVLKSDSTAIVETGPASSVPTLISGINELGIDLEDVAYVAVSHIHLDHGGGVGTLVKKLPRARVVVHPRGASHLVHPEKLWQQSREVLGEIAELYGPPEPVPEEKILASPDGTVFDLGDDVKLRVVETLGHASHHQSYYETSDGGVFPGDAAGIYLQEVDAVVPTTPSPLRLDMALASIQRLINLKPEALYYSHFGKAGEAVQRLHAYEHQLMLWARIAKEGVQNGEGVETIGTRIAEIDDMVRRVRKYIESHPVLGETVLRESVQGFVDYVTKFEVSI